MNTIEIDLTQDEAKAVQIAEAWGFSATFGLYALNTLESLPVALASETSDNLVDRYLGLLLANILSKQKIANQAAFNDVTGRLNELASDITQLLAEVDDEHSALYQQLITKIKDLDRVINCLKGLE